MALNNYHFLCATEPNLSGSLINLQSYLRLRGNIIDCDELDKLDIYKDIDQNAQAPGSSFTVAKALIDNKVGLYQEEYLGVVKEIVLDMHIKLECE
ncbi:hypothetical protein [Solimicrobium silvestre]|uniref:Uncharacterized protein n=1 Tax=Solimicrobium silvestre TaxID=2099400 RepID=A0A2S9GVN3_9BURK|nr:hypothetical protein [Solimicrobium silvestre]PRC91783.1 hypothetical protein S2091_3538 [Solimicrobium silvestre]